MALMTDTLTLNSGAQMPVLGLGTWKSKSGEVSEAVKVAIDQGYRHIDCAYAYGNEKEVGQGIAAKLSDGTVTRSDIFVTSKLAPTSNPPERVEECCRASLKNLQLDYLDLYLIHWPVALKEGGVLLENERDVHFLDTWREMEKLVELGLTKSIGMSNFNILQLQEVLNVCKIKPSVNQFEVHPYLDNNALVNFCKDQGIVVTAYAPFASPDPGRATRKDDDPKPLEDVHVKKIAQAKNKSPGQLGDFQLSTEEMDSIDSININFRACIGAPFVKSKYYPFK